MIISEYAIESLRRYDEERLVVELERRRVQLERLDGEPAPRRWAFPRWFHLAEQPTGSHGVTRGPAH